MKNISRYGPIIVAALLMLIYLPTFVWMKARFDEVESYYSHGYLVPLVFAYLIWMKRDELRKCAIKPAGLALLIFVPALLVHLLAYFFEINFVSGFTLIAAIFGLALYLYGPDIAKKTAFPVIFLIFMVPLPQVMIINISFKMKMMAAQVATGIVNLIGIHAVRDGSIVYLKPDTSLTIGSPCSGLSSLIALTALGALYAYLAKMSGSRKIILFLLSIPIALAANIFRIVMLLLVGFAYDAKVATGPFVHGFLAFLLYIFAIAGLLIVGRMLSWAKMNAT
ncbi:MAG: exosortase [Candidatus Omnitrophica bacterium]|nr:exosortase [Candidatus Omnitrophota bacterium]MDD5310153.1 exosortase [Candidatus Omnitrophota bacterium]MDD5546270.1 exosortase [Candidatus Omnitrophota bacterium]